MIHKPSRNSSSIVLADSLYEGFLCAESGDVHQYDQNKMK